MRRLSVSSKHGGSEGSGGGGGGGWALPGDSGIEWVGGSLLAVEGDLSLNLPTRPFVGLDGPGAVPALKVHSSELASVALEPFDAKQRWFYERLARLRVPWHGGHQEVHVRRGNVLADSVRELSARSPEQFRQTWRFKFSGEPGIDGGGLAREWWEAVIAAVFAPSSGLFVATATDSLAFNIDAASAEAMAHPERAFRFVGRLLGKALLDKQAVGAYLCRPLFKHTLGLPVGLGDLAAVDEALHGTLAWLLAHDGVEALECYFAVDEVVGGKLRTRELVPGGGDERVIDANKERFVRLRWHDALLSKPGFGAALAALLRGLYEVVPLPLLTVFDAGELELMLCGVPDIDVADWREHTTYAGGCEWRGALVCVCGVPGACAAKVEE